MNKTKEFLLIGAVFLFLSGCTVQTVTYEPAYRTSYVYTAGYYPDDYYVGSGEGYWGNPGYYDTYYYVGY